jgi:hypothetical protein
LIAVSNNINCVSVIFLFFLSKKKLYRSFALNKLNSK